MIISCDTFPQGKGVNTRQWLSPTLFVLTIIYHFLQVCALHYTLMALCTPVTSTYRISTHSCFHMGHQSWSSVFLYQILFFHFYPLLHNSSSISLWYTSSLLNYYHLTFDFGPTWTGHFFLPLTHNLTVSSAIILSYIMGCWLFYFTHISSFVQAWLWLWMSDLLICF